jgi:DNA helicase-2/ATP-dependent DNA helicase PcrA
VLGQFLATTALDAGDTQAEPHSDSIQLMTLHSAKGLEFPLVFISGVEENLFPHKMSMEEPGQLEEERRLCYVGITRAKRKLYLTYAESRRLYGSDAFNMPSRFIREIPSDLLEEVRPRMQVSRPMYNARSPQAAPVRPTPDQDSDLHLGQRVRHAVFGEGFILNVEGSGARTRVQVSFDHEGLKWLMLSHANLTPA